MKIESESKRASLTLESCCVELDPLYCDVIVTRWEAFTGKRVSRERRKRAWPATAESE